jgi:hypothetical protein
MLHHAFGRLAVVLFVSFFAFATLLTGEADAAKKKKKRRPAAKAKVTHKIDAKALGELMGPYKFGMSKKQILGILNHQITDRYKEKISATTDVYMQDKLRRKKAAELARIKKSFIEFKGNKSGWDVSIIDDQFAHNTDESMMVHWENSPDTGRDQRRFFFFQDGRLYKMFVALNTSQLKNDQRKFSFFQSLMEARYGKGSVVVSKDLDGVERPTAIEWNSKTHHVMAIDKLAFYGSFCLMVADPGREEHLASLRKASAPVKKQNSVLKSVMSDEKEDDTPGLNDNKAAVDAVLR